MRPFLIATTLLFSLAPSSFAQDPKKLPPQPAVVEDPLVTAVLETNPTTPREMVRAVQTLLNLKHPAVAKQFVDRLNAANLDDDALAELGRSFGTGLFLTMALTPELKPGSEQLSNRVLIATEKWAKDPARIAGLIGKLHDAPAAVRRGAVSQLRAAGPAGVNAVISALAKAGENQRQQELKAALAGLGSTAVGPLIAVLESENQALKAHAIDVLDAVDAREAVQYCIGPAVAKDSSEQLRSSAAAALRRVLLRVPNLPDAVTFLTNRATLYFNGVRPGPIDHLGNIPLWQWDAAKGEAVQRAYSAEDASMAVCHRLARDLLNLAPNNRAARRLYLTSLLQLAKYGHGIHQPLPAGAGSAGETAARFGAAALEDLLAWSLSENKIAAATAAARLLGRQGDASLLHRLGEKPSPLTAAAAHPDLRLRFAALEAIMHINPQKAFPHCSEVARSLAFFANSSGVLRVLVADARISNARRTAGLLAELGYDAEIATTPRGLVSLAMDSADYAFILVDARLPGTRPQQIIQRLRFDSRSAGLPVAFVTPLEELDEINELVREHPRTASMVRARDVPSVRFQVNRLLATVGRDFVSLSERMAFAEAAWKWMAQIVKTERPPGPLYDLRRQDAIAESALYVPQLNPHAADFLAHAPTPLGQVALVNFASQNTVPLAMRKTAADAFRRSYQHRGLWLTAEQIERQYDRYNQSAELDQGTQEVLGDVLDTIELKVKKTKKKTTDAKP